MRMRIVKARKQRAIDPRTKGEAQGKISISAMDKYLPHLTNPYRAAELHHIQYWINASDNATSEAIGSLMIAATYKGVKADDQADDAKVALLKEFLESDKRSYLTVQERLAALAKDYGIFGYCAIEVGRGLNRIPVAWYHCPAVTVRELRDGTGYDQIDDGGKVLQHFARYEPGGNKDGLPELLVIKKYDPSAKYMSAMDTSALAETALRLSGQDGLNNTLLRKGGLPPSLLMLKESLSDDDYKRLQEYLNEMEQGQGQSLIGVLDGVGEGELKKLVEDSNEASYLTGEEKLRERVMAVKRVPPSVLGLPVVNYAVAKMERAIYRDYVLHQIVNLILHRLNIIADEIVPDAGYDYQVVPGRNDEFVELAGVLTGLVDRGIFSRNMALAELGKEGMGPEGDDFTIQTAMGVVKLKDAISVAGNITAGRMVDTLAELRRTILEIRQQGTQQDPHK